MKNALGFQRKSEYTLSDRLTFGKHKGYSIQYVLDEDPDWLLWAHDNIDWFSLSPKILDQVNRITAQKESEVWEFHGMVDPYEVFDDD